MPSLDPFAAAEPVKEQAVSIESPPPVIFTDFRVDIASVGGIHNDCVSAIAVQRCYPAFDKLMSSQDQGYFNTPSRDYIENEVKERAEEWLFVNAAKRLDNTIPYRFMGGALDTLTPPKVHIQPIMEELAKCECDMEYIEFCDGHTFPAARVRLTEQIISYLNKMEERT